LNIIRKLVSQTATYGLSSIIGRLLNYLLVPIYTRVFLPEEYGVVTELYAYVAFFAVILTYGLETAYFRFVSNQDLTPKDKATVYSTSLISLFVTSSIFIIITHSFSVEIAGSLGYSENIKYVEWLAIIIAIDAVSSISFARLRNENKALRFATVRVLNILINISLNLYFILYLKYGIEYIFIANLISSIITIILLFPQMFDAGLAFSMKLWRKMMVYALPLLFAGLAGITNEVIDRILLKSYILDSENPMYEIGLYGAFYKLSIIMTLFIQTFRYAAEPFFFNQKATKNNKAIYADVMKYFIVVMSVIFLTVTIFYDFFQMFLGPEYHDQRGFTVVSILLLANFFLGVYYNLAIWYKLTDKTIYGAGLSFLGATITITLNIILIPFFGFVGSAWATLACYSIMTTCSYFLSKRFFPINYNLSRIGLYFISMLSIYLCTYFINMWFNVLLLLLFVILVLFLEKNDFKRYSYK